jgi:hypothetical protein
MIRQRSGTGSDSRRMKGVGGDTLLESGGGGT